MFCNLKNKFKPRTISGQKLMGDDWELGKMIIENSTLAEEKASFKDKSIDKILGISRSLLKRDKTFQDPQSISLTKLKREKVYAEYKQIIEEFKQKPNGKEIIQEAKNRAKLDLKSIKKRYKRTTIKSNKISFFSAIANLICFCIVVALCIPDTNLKAAFYFNSLNDLNFGNLIEELKYNRRMFMEFCPFGSILELVVIASLSLYAFGDAIVLQEKQLAKKQLVIDVLKNEAEKDPNDFLTK